MAAVVATMMAVVPMGANMLVPFLSKRLGKRNLYSLSALVQFLGIFVIMLADRNTVGILIGAFISAAGYGAKESIYFSMQADPVDYGEWKSGVQTAGILSSVNGFLGKVAQAVAGGLSGVLLAMGNYENSSVVQSSEALLSIKAMYLYLPMILLVCSIIIMHFYTLDKELPQIQKELNERKSGNIKREEPVK